MDFSDILDRGKKIFRTKDKGGTWGRCEQCSERRVLYQYEDKVNQTWTLCEQCIDILSKDE